MLTWSEKRLYKRKKYSALLNKMNRSKDDLARFTKLCVGDPALQTWYVEYTSQLWHEVFANPKLATEMEKSLKRSGDVKLYDLQKKIQQKGFATYQEYADAIGFSVEDVKSIEASNPELLKGLRVRNDCYDILKSS